MDPSIDQLNDYTHYLQSQVEKFTSFMITQKKLNEKHLLIESSLQRVFHKVSKAQEKIKLLEANHKDNLLELRKIKAQKQAFKIMELRLENIQRQLSSIVKLDLCPSLQHISEHSSMYQNSQPQKTKNKRSVPQNLHQDIQSLEKYFTGLFINRQEVQQIVNKNKEELDFRIKKLQIEIDKSKESFLKLANHISSLSVNLGHESMNKKQLKNENRIGCQSTRDMNVEPFNQQNIVTKKQLRKMQKKLQNFFSQKLSSIVTKHQNEFEVIPTQKALKFKKMQQKYDRLTLENANQRQTRSQGKIDLSQKQYSSNKKIPLFDNQVLKQKHMNLPLHNQGKMKKSKSGSLKESPRGTHGSLRQVQVNRNSNSRSQLKKMTKKKSPQRLKKVNLDYMIK